MNVFLFTFYSMTYNVSFQLWRLDIFGTKGNFSHSHRIVEVIKQKIRLFQHSVLREQKYNVVWTFQMN